jgi:hypothetical protein
MKRLRLLAASAAILLPGMAANAQQMMPSETDIFALYCFGALRLYLDGIDDLFAQTCPTGKERGCEADRAAIAKQRDGMSRLTRYITARGYNSGAAPADVVQRALFTVKSGENDAMKCAKNSMDNIVAGRRAPVPVCAQTKRCNDLSRLPM